MDSVVPGIDIASVDKALSTTRVVRRRLDLERPVDDEVLLECIDIAEQAPTGGNQGSRRWIIVSDQAVKEQLAALYMEAAGEWMIESAGKIGGTGHPQEQVMASAAHLAQHLAEVPAIVIPTIIGIHDNSGRPGLFDSIIQSVWSFSVALRARGLGSAYTTAILGKRDELAELLGVPEGMTQIAMLPVAWTKGTEFRLAPRLPAREIAYFDRFSRTWERGPSNPHSLADGPGTVVEVDIKAPSELVWPYVSDISFGAEFSDEFMGARWAEEVTEPHLGARFIGSNANEHMGDWDLDCIVNRYEENRSFGWATSDKDNPGARWWFESTPIAGATRLRYSVALGPGPSGLTMAITNMPDKEPRIIARRIENLRENMTNVVNGVKEAAEQDAAAQRAERGESKSKPPLH
jgi:nitroreductase